MDVAAGVIGVASLAIQLADSVKKLSDFWRSVEEAPLDIQNIISDLDFLNLLLCEIANEAQETQPNATLEKVLDICKARVKVLNSVIRQFEPGFSSAKYRIRKWTAIKSVLKREKIERSSVTLDRLNTLLIIVLRNIDSHSSRTRFQLQEESFAAIRTALQGLTITPGSDIISHMTTNQNGTSLDTTLDKPGQLLAPQYQLLSTSKTKYTPSGQKVGPQRKRNLLFTDFWIQNSICGNIIVHSRHNQSYLASLDKTTEWIDEETPSESRTLVTIRPAKWLSILGIKSGLILDLTSSSVRGWKHTLSSFRVVPDDALIFDFCKQGNLGAVQLLLSRGEASAKDTNSAGLQPLHIAAGYSHTDLCKLLIEHGADKSAEATYKPWRCYPITPLGMAITYSYPHTTRSKDDLESMMATIRLFFDVVDFSELGDRGWGIFADLVDNQGTRQCELEMSGLFEWLLLRFRDDLKSYYMEDKFMSILDWLANTMPSALPLWLSLGPSGAINAPDKEGYVLARQLVYLREEKLVVILSEMLTCGADPNRECEWPDASPKMESPTTFSMYSNYGFSTWLAALNKAGIDANEAFDKELKQETFAEAGWTRENFQRLTGWRYTYDAPLDPVWCTICADHIVHLKIQPIWIYALEEIKNGKDPNDTIWATSLRSEESSESEPDIDDPSDVSQMLRESQDDDVEMQDEAEDTELIESSSFSWDSDIFLALHKSFCETETCILMFPNGNWRLEGATEDKSCTRAVQFDLESWRDLRNEDIVCMRCWLVLIGMDPKKIPYDSDGYRIPSSNTDLSDADTDASSEHEFSPFLLHT